MSRDCTCPADGTAYCAPCAALALRAGVTLPVEAPRTILHPHGWMDPASPEALLESRLRTLAKAAGYLYYHTYNSKRSDPGFPDCAIVHPDGGPLYLWELKRADGTISPAQRQWLDALRGVTHVETGVCRPGDWAEMQAMLTRRSRAC